MSEEFDEWLWIETILNVVRYHGLHFDRAAHATPVLPDWST